MTVTIEFTPEEETLLKQGAEQKGLEASEYLRRLWLSETMIKRDAKGSPRIAGTRTRVSLIAVARDMYGDTPEQIANESYPHLSLAQVNAALAFYDAHKEEIDAEIKATDELFEKLKAESGQPTFEEMKERLRQKQAS